MWLHGSGSAFVCSTDASPLWDVYSHVLQIWLRSKHMRRIGELNLGLPRDILTAEILTTTQREV